MTNQELIDRALIAANVIGAGEAGNATDSADALEMLNEMMSQWGQGAADLNWFTQDTLAETVPVPIWARSAVITNLAIAWCDEANTPAPPGLERKADKALMALKRILINRRLENTDMTHLPMGTGRTGIYDIEADNL